MAKTEEKTSVEVLTAMKAKIDAAKTDRARLEGQLADRMTRLKTLGFDSVAAGETRLKELREEIAQFDSRVADGIKELHEKYGL